MPRTMHDHEIFTDVRLVRRLLKSQFPEWAALPLARVRWSGTDNALYRLGDDMVVRLPRIDWAVDDSDWDFEWLPQLARRLPLAIPEPLAKGEPAPEYPYYWRIYTWLEGENPKVGRIADPATLAHDLATFVRGLHAIDLAGGEPASRGEPLTQRDQPTRKAIAECGGFIDTRAVTAAWEAALATPSWHRPPVWIHADLSPGNLLLTDGRLSGVIDCDSVGVGDPAVDLIPAWNTLPANVRGIYRDTLGVDDATWQRGLGWALSIALIQLPYYRTRSRPLAANARHVIREVLAHPRRRSGSAGDGRRTGNS